MILNEVIVSVSVRLFMHNMMSFEQCKSRSLDVRKRNVSEKFLNLLKYES